MVDSTAPKLVAMSVIHRANPLPDGPVAGFVDLLRAG
jgi:hypothetical protein